MNSLKFNKDEIIALEESDIKQLFEEGSINIFTNTKKVNSIELGTGSDYSKNGIKYREGSNHWYYIVYDVKSLSGFVDSKNYDINLFLDNSYLGEYDKDSKYNLSTLNLKFSTDRPLKKLLVQNKDTEFNNYLSLSDLISKELILEKARIEISSGNDYIGLLSFDEIDDSGDYIWIENNLCLFKLDFLVHQINSIELFPFKLNL